MMICPQCNFRLPVRTCPACGEDTPDVGKYCCFCGAAAQDETSAGASAEGDFDLSDRILCPDGACIGVINEHGVCSECGRPYEGEEK